MGGFSCAECHMSPWKLSHLLSSPSPVNAATLDPEDRQTNSVNTCKNVLKMCQNVLRRILHKGVINRFILYGM